MLAKTLLLVAGLGFAWPAEAPLDSKPASLESRGLIRAAAELDAPPCTPALSSAPELTRLQRFAGMVTFVNVLWVLAIAGGVGCASFLFGSYVRELMRWLRDVPLVVYEALFHVSAAAFLFGGFQLSAAVGPYVGLTGCLLFLAALGFTVNHRKLELGGARFALILFAVWAAAALAYRSSMLGFIAVGALLAALGFTAAIFPLCYMIGFRDKDSVGRTTAAALCLLAAFVALRVWGEAWPQALVFERGALFLGSFVGYLGLLIGSSRWLAKPDTYAYRQVVTIAAGLAALYFGSVLGIAELQRIGGTFFVLYLLEKPAEIPLPNERAYAALGLAMASAVYAGCLFFKANPELARQFLLGAA